MIIRTLLLFTTGFLIVSISYAQVRIGIKAGGNIATTMYDVDSDDIREPETKFKMGFHIGAIADIPLIANTLSLQPGLLYSNKGVSYDMEKMLKHINSQINPTSDLTNYDGYFRLNYNYIELPIHVAYKVKNLQVYAGPYVAVGIGGRLRHDFSYELHGKKFDSNDHYEKDPYTLKPVYDEVDQKEFNDALDDEDIFRLYRGFDAGINFGFGYQINRILINAGYSLGLVNMAPDFDKSIRNKDYHHSENIIQKNRVITFSVSYFFI